MDTIGTSSVFTLEAQARLFRHFSAAEIRLLELFMRGLMDEREAGAKAAPVRLALPAQVKLTCPDGSSLVRDYSGRTVETAIALGCTVEAHGGERLA